MSSTGQAIGGVIGAVVGFFTPLGPIYGAQIGMMIGGALDPPKGPTLQGPRLSDLSVQTSTYGAVIPRGYGVFPVVGNIFWLEGDKLREVIRKEKQGGKGGGGGAEVETASYYATFAVGLCHGPIAGIRRLWLGGKLVYDASSMDLESIIASNRAGVVLSASSSDIVQSVASKGSSVGRVRVIVYTGTEDQEPDPRMQADKGAANVSAHRGLAYLAFYDLPLADYGNSLMGVQVKAEVIVADTPQSYALIEVAHQQKSVSGGLRAIWGEYPGGDRWATVTNGPAPVGQVWVTEYVAGQQVKAYPNDDGFRFANTENMGLVTRTDDFSTVLRERRPASFWLYNIPDLNNIVSAARKASGRVFMIGQLNSDVSILHRLFVFDTPADEAAIYESTVLTSVGLSPVSARGCIFGEHIFSWVPVGIGLDVTLYDEDIAVIDTFSIADALGFSGTTWACAHAANGNLYLLDQDRAMRLLVIDGNRNATMVFLEGYDDRNTFVANSMQVDGSLVRILGINGSGESAFGQTYFFNLPVGSQTATLGDIVLAESLQSNLLAAEDIDVSELTDVVRGYRVAAVGAIRSAIEPLQGAWPFDVIQSGYKIKCKKRGGASIATIPFSRLDARKAGDAPGVQLPMPREMDSQLPRRVSIKHLDAEREYDTGEQYAERLNTEAVNLREIEMPIVLTSQEAAQKAEVLLYHYWLERWDVGPFNLPPEYCHLEPADVITLQGEDATYDIRLAQIEYTDDFRLVCNGKFANAAVYTSTATGTAGQSPGATTIGLDGPSNWVLMDIPLLRERDNAPGYAAAMAGYTAAWPGGILYRSTDAGQTWAPLQGFAGSVPIGYAVNAIGAGRTDIIDATNVLQVAAIGTSPASVTQLEMFNGANHYAYGADGRWEIIAAQTCALQADGSYLFSDLLRGRFGTEWAMTLHQIGDSVVAITDEDVAFMVTESASIGVERLYRGITARRSIDSDTDRAFTCRGVNLKPLSPVNLNGSRHPTTNDWTLLWTRRTRIPSTWGWVAGVPLGETTETYEIEIYANGTYATVKRTLTATGPTVPYTSAQQVADFGANQATLYVKVYQMSATVGRGHPLQATITR